MRQGEVRARLICPLDVDDKPMYIFKVDRIGFVTVVTLYCETNCTYFGETTRFDLMVIFERILEPSYT